MPYTAEQVRSRHPFELLFLGVATAQGISGLISPEFRPGSIEGTIGPVGTVAWYLVILLGSIAATVGIAWPERATGLILERVGLLATGLSTLFYGVVAVILLGGVAVYPALTICGYAVAALWRARQIRRFLATVAKESPDNSGE